MYKNLFKCPRKKYEHNHLQNNGECSDLVFKPSANPIKLHF